MKSLWRLGFMTLLIEVPVTAQKNVDEILLMSEAAYAALTTYIGTTIVEDHLETDVMKLEKTATAKIVFARPGRINIQGKIETGMFPAQTFEIISNGNITWRSWSIIDGGVFKIEKSLEMAIAGMTGVAVNAPTTIPAALMKMSWGYPFTQALTSGAQLEGSEKIDSLDCYKIVSVSDINTRTYWIDAENFLLRQIKDEQTEKQLAALQKRTKEQTDKFAKERGINVPALNMKSRVTLHKFIVESINGSIDEKLFADPTRGKKE